MHQEGERVCRHCHRRCRCYIPLGMPRVFYEAQRSRSPCRRAQRCYATSVNVPCCASATKKGYPLTPKGQICQVGAVAEQACCGLLCLRQPPFHHTVSLARPQQPTSNNSAHCLGLAARCGSACCACNHCTPLQRCQPDKQHSGDRIIPNQITNTV